LLCTWIVQISSGLFGILTATYGWIPASENTGEQHQAFQKIEDTELGRFTGVTGYARSATLKKVRCTINANADQNLRKKFGYKHGRKEARRK
jgi:hypothetical protein